MANTYRDKVVEEGLEEPIEQTSPSEAARATESTETPSEPSRPKRRTPHRVPRLPKISGRWALRQLPLVVLIVIYCIVLVSNRYKVEQLSKEKIRLEREIDYLREQRIQMQREYQENIKISRIAQKLDTIGVGLISGPPYEIQREEPVFDNKKKR